MKLLNFFSSFTSQPDSKTKDKTLTSELLASLEKLKDSIKNFAQPGEKLAVHLLDYDGCLEYVFWERHSNFWFCTRFSNHPEYKAKFASMVKKCKNKYGSEDYKKIEEILGKNQEFQKLKRSVCEPIAKTILSNLALMAQNKKIIIIIASNRQFINTELRAALRDGSDFCFENFKVLENMLNAKLGNKKCLFIPWLFEDFCQNKEIGTTVKYFLESKDSIMKWKSNKSEVYVDKMRYIDNVIGGDTLIEELDLKAMTGPEIDQAIKNIHESLLKDGLVKAADKLNAVRSDELVCLKSDVFKYAFLLEICKYLEKVFPTNPMNLIFADDLEKLLNVVEFCFLKNIKELPDNIQIDLVQICVNLNTTFEPVSKLINLQPIRKDYFIDSTDLPDIKESKWFKYLKLKTSKQEQEYQAKSIENLSKFFIESKYNKSESAEIIRMLDFIRLTDLVTTLNKIYPPNSTLSALDKISAMAKSEGGKLPLLTTLCQYSEKNNSEEEKKDEKHNGENPRIMYHLTRSQSQCIFNTLINQKRYDFKSKRGTKERINEALENNFCKLDFNSDYTCFYADDGYGIYTTQSEWAKINLLYFVPQQNNLEELKDLVNEIQKYTDDFMMDKLRALKYQLENCCTNKTSHVALQKFLQYLDEEIQNKEEPLLTVITTLIRIGQDLEKGISHKPNRSLSNGSMFSSSSSSASTIINTNTSESSTSSTSSISSSGLETGSFS